MSAPPGRWAWAEIDLDAVGHNISVLRAAVAPAEVLAVVKADGYGHGAIAIAQAALGAGATWLGVALVHEGVELRIAGIAAPILLLSQQPPELSADIVAHRLTPTVYEAGAADALDRAAAATEGSVESIGVHVKVDTGMHRVGCRPEDLAVLIKHVEALAHVHLAGLFTHLAVADEPGDPYSAAQLARFDEALAAIESTSPGWLDGVIIHAANSAGALAHDAAHRHLVRVGIAMYGLEPGDGVADRCADLRPVMSLKARVSFVKRVGADERISYGLRHRFDRPATVATIPIGYADGVPRRLFQTGGEVLIGGRRRPIVGVVTMDQLMADCGDDEIAVGDEVVLIGTQGAERIRAEDWASRLGTIPYEITCGISQRIPRLTKAGASGR